MRFSLIALVRLIVFTAIGLCTLAVGLGRMMPEPPALRRYAAAGLVHVDRLACGFSGDASWLLDASTGELRRLDLPANDSFDHVSSSPWVDGSGRRQVVGRWTRLEGSATNRHGEAFGLARYALPGGEVLDYVETSEMPNSPPCWVPGTTAQVVFSAADGQLYRLDFERDRTDQADRQGLRTPRPLVWDVRPPGEGYVMVSDPVWPRLAGLDRYVLVALSFRRRNSERVELTAPRIWWLELNASATAIVAAGPVTEPAPGGLDDRAERLPAIARTNGGDLVLAYLSSRPRDSAWHLNVAPLWLPDGPTAQAGIEAGSALVLAENCRPSPLAFGPDATRLYCMEQVEGATRARHRPIDLASIVAPHRRTVALGALLALADHVRSESLLQLPPWTTGGSSQRALGTTLATNPTSRSGR